MPFDPFNRQPERPTSVRPIDDGDAELPADFMTLGEQLRDDAARLAACYPADLTTRKVAVVAAASRRRLPWMHVAAAIVVLASGIGVGVRMRSVGMPGQAADDRIATIQPSAGPRLTADAIPDGDFDVGDGYLLAGDIHSTAGLIVPAVLFQNLSGPEQEGLLDLLDDIVSDAIDLSM